MSQTNYERGAVFERSVKKKLEAAGWFVVRIAGSHSAADLVAIRRSDHAHAAMIQCKTNGELSPKEWNELFNTARHVGAWPYLAQRVKRKLQILQLMGPKIARKKQPILDASWMLKDQE
jgi:Holliday junction resolvase